MGTPLYWVEGPWQGKLALSPRPRGGDWLSDEIAAWRRSGIDTVLSLLTPDEEEALDLNKEKRETEAHGMEFVSYPIPDRQVPQSPSELAATLEQINSELLQGKNVVVHCRQGVGRSGLMGACLLVMRGLDPRTAVQKLSDARGVAIPDTAEQRRWIDRYASTLTGTK
jgi:protein-tyrosine phosphatase